MEALRVEIYAPVTSFRYPFFVVGRQPTYALPPPSTVLGHCASALGRWPDEAWRAGFSFGLFFSFRSRTSDLEHEHIAKALGAKSRTEVPSPEGPLRATTEVTVQPVVRDFLFDTRLTLYLVVEPEERLGELEAAFRAPAHTVVLGRSQDLAEVVAVERVQLERPARARLERTLLPAVVRPCLRSGTMLLLTRYIGPAPERKVEFAQYIALGEPAFFGPDADPATAFLRAEGVALDALWCDPSIRDEEQYPRGVWLHRIAGAEAGPAAPAHPAG